MSIRLLHFADAHIDCAATGKKDPQTGLSVRTIDFLNALDQIVDCALHESIDLVLFAGDAYRDPTPVPTFQREWGKRMKRLSDARIPVLMLPGNHDVSPASTRANALQEYDTLEVPYLHLAKSIKLWKPTELHGLPIQVLAVPWVPKSMMIAAFDTRRMTSDEIHQQLEFEISKRIETAIGEIDPQIPAVLLAHYSVPGAEYPNHQAVSLGREVTLSGGLVKNPCFSYTALGHIHKYQDLNEGFQPPVIYSGSIERVNFGESREEKGFIIAEIENHHTTCSFRKLSGRKFFNTEITISSAESFQQEVLDALPNQVDMRDAMVRLVVNYPQNWESSLDEMEIRKKTESALEFHLVRKAIQTQRIRFQDHSGISALSPMELLEKYCEIQSIDSGEIGVLMSLAQSIVDEDLQKFEI
jgi:exonuclease SbcD